MNLSCVVLLLAQAFSCNTCDDGKCSVQKCPNGLHHCMTEKYLQSGVEVNLTACSAPEFCNVNKTKVCSFLKSQLHIWNEPNVSDCTISCSPKPTNEEPINTNQSCDTCFDSKVKGQERVKSECVKRKCYPGFTKCKTISYSVESKLQNYKEQFVMKSCASETECNIKQEEWRKFFRGIRALRMPDIVVTGFSMQCSSASEMYIHRFFLMVLCIVVQFVVKVNW